MRGLPVLGIRGVLLVRSGLDRVGHGQVDGVYVANVADQKAEPELKLLGGLQAVLFNIHVCHLGRSGFRV